MEAVLLLPLILLLLAPMAKVNNEMPLVGARIPVCCCCCKCNGLDGGRRDVDVKPTAPVANERQAMALTTVILFLLVTLWQGRGDILLFKMWKNRKI